MLSKNTTKHIIRRIGILFILLILCVVYLLYAEKNEVVFEKESGFYDEPFYLTLSSSLPDDYVIYYTTDSTTPTKESLVYDKPIYIGGSNVRCYNGKALKDFIPESMDEIQTIYSITNHNVGPLGFIGSLNSDDDINYPFVIKAMCVDSKGRCSTVKTEVYFIGQNHEENNQFYTVSIVTDPDDLYDYYDGIFRSGYQFDKSLDSYINWGDYSYGDWRYFALWSDGNYRQTGEESEKEASILTWNENNELISDENCGIRVAGYGSRVQLHKSLNVFGLHNGGYRCIAEETIRYHF